MMIPCAANLLFDTDQDTLFEVDEIRHDQVWTSVRVYQLLEGEEAQYEVWFFDWDPKTNQETSHFGQTFPNFDAAKLWAIELAKKGSLNQ